MITFAARQIQRAAASVSLLAIVTIPGVALSQQASDAFLERELQITEAIERTQLDDGSYARQLIEPLTELATLYEAAGNLRLADAAIERLLPVIRANYGLHSLEQLPWMRLLMAHELERGFPAAAWELEQEIIELGLRHRDDVRTGRIFRDVADRRIDILRRYDTGELPAEIELGCYYKETNEYLRAQRRGSRPISTAPGQSRGNSCAAGSRSRARRALANEAYTFYLAAMEIFMRNELGASDEFRQLLTSLVHSGYQYDAPSIGRNALQRLIASYPEDAQDPLPRIEALVALADWDLVYSSVLGTKHRDSALAAYEDAYDELLEHGIEQESIDALFSPDVPVMLPSFRQNPLVSAETPRSTGHIDVALVITADGKGNDVEVLDTTTDDVPRDVRKDLVRAAKRGRFRPIMTDGLSVSTPVVVRYYVNP